MKLGELAFACHVYSHMTDYDSSFRRLLNATKPRLDLQNSDHVLRLLKWLNDWGCRQFAKKHHEMAAREITHWNGEFADILIPVERPMFLLSGDDLKNVKTYYSSLCCKTASRRISRSREESTVVVGPTGAAKILFALRPNSLIPWDEPIRKKFRLDGTADSYCKYLLIAKAHLEELGNDCRKNGFDLAELPDKLNRQESSLAKLIDEYYWVTVSRKCPVPDASTLQRWISWM